jgi:hypothetical protein
MDETTPTQAGEIAALREAYAALNRNDIPAMLEVFDPQIEWTDPSEEPGAGRAAVEAHLSQARDTWAEGSCEPEEFLVAGDKIIVFVHVHVKLKHRAELAEGRLADVYTFRHGKAVHMRSFPDRQKAVEWAGGDTSA